VTLRGSQGESRVNDVGSLAQFAYEELREQLITLQIPPGHPLNEAELGKSLGVGRTTIREAVRRLECDYLIVSYPRRGTFATTVDLAELSEVTEVRVLLEPLAARRAAKSATPEFREELRQRAVFLDELDPQTDERSLMRHDMAVHRLIYQAAANRRLEEMLIRYDNLATRIWCYLLDRLPSVAGHIKENSVLLRAIADGDEHSASSLAENSIEEFEAVVRKAL
jgi:DNA-binding GntR family transcriptional regulator